MTTGPGPVGTDPVRGRSGSVTSRVLDLVGIAVVSYWFVRTGLADAAPAWVWIVGTVALAAWLLRVLTGSDRVLVVATWGMVLAGATVVVPTGALMVAVPLVGVVVLAARRPVWAGPVAAVVALVLVAATAVVAGAPVTVVLGTGGGLLLAAAVGSGRRQARIAEERTRQAEVERQRAELLADRTRAAREVHDVLAHSLGGLVLQLDAVEALLEAGRVDEATRRAGEARTLAASGLAEARRAVHALREDVPAPQTSGPAAPTDLPALVAAHRSFGGTVTTHGDVALTAVDAAHRAAVVAAVREALSNARRHAAGRPVVLSVERDGDAVRVTVANPLGPGAGTPHAGGPDPDGPGSGLADSGGPARTGDGHGVVGMRERFAELGDGSALHAGVLDGAFVVTMRVPGVTS
ncbi:sensor histidine kinase [Curtobacterium sp. MCBA15_004]|uniref:sensor histidine kinase n=1 Tax=unclassified Curtobacterium TaxID=257496 RepID=UPI0009F1A3DC|nr:histidine kinase [Curtobacterium sp. MCBA15_004]WIA96649.1 histidine kinase [Curtobacterium sp. MCBA15_004]